MFIAIITKSTGMLGPIVNLFGYIMNAIFNFFNMFGIQNIALSIIVFTLITKMIMLPLTIKQQKFTKLQSRMSPEIQAIAAKYKGKKDEISLKRQQAETQEVYKKYGASQTAGCLPMLLSLPIMLALYSVINNIPAHVNIVKDIYQNIATAISSTDGYAEILMEMSKGLTIKTKSFTEISEGILTNNHIIDVLSKFRTTNWDILIEKIPSIQGIVTNNVNEINNVNSLFGILNISDNPGWAFPGIIIPFLSMVLQFVQTKQMTAGTQAPSKDDPSASTMNSMNTVMPIMSGVFCVMLPIGVGLYWVASSFFTIIQQHFINKYFDKIGIDEMIEKNKIKQNKKNQKHPNETIKKVANQYTKSIDTYKTEEVKTDVIDNKPISTGGIAEIANILKNKNIDKGDKQ
ncbi:MAG TPA: YidC/Oxa1 family membrane protein insertase [Clostridiales bacterium]|nr:YidC/Oxa1 family membrane protein insertase [Clostridiales bacterium]